MPGFAILAEPWWVPVLWVVVFGHITNLCVTLYLHRSATHEGVVFHPAVRNFMRFWLWLTTGMITKQWVAVHRKHHAFSDREGDPHSPAVEGLLEIVFGGVFFYKNAVSDKEMVEKYGKGCPEDWIEHNLFQRAPFAGLATMMVVDAFLFGLPTGLVVWVCMAVWIPLFGNIINGVGHAIGYRNFATKDESRNIVPLGLLIVGEELHNNHHADPRSAKFNAKWYEFDIGWLYIRLLAAMRLANVIYARSVSAKEFAEKYYHTASEKAANASAAALEAASAAGTRAKEAAGAAGTRAKEAAGAAGARAKEAAGAAGAKAREAAEVVGARAREAARAAIPEDPPLHATD
jgi:stearoyl-CoA desaturase (delta-9 desaturase)